MNASLLAPLALLFMVLAQYVVTGRAVYHAGWYNALLLALLVLSYAWQRGIAKRDPQFRNATLLALAGIIAIGAGGLANGLFAPDDSTIVGSPGAAVAAPDLRGTLAFPLASSSAAPIFVALQRGSSSLAIPSRGARFSGGFMLSESMRSVAGIDAADAGGHHLTITQPNGTAFLSPILMFAQKQPIANLNAPVPYDSFAVPAMHRIVSAVYLDPATAASMQAGGDGRAVVLFAVDDEDGRPVAHGIGLARDGQTVLAGGLSLTPHVFSYPAVTLVAVPLPIVTVIGLLLILAGVVVAFRGKKSDSLDASLANG